ncbi:MAG: hypothetical protein WC757_04685 [Candidatus Paceibacterota bacterium]
MRNILDLRKKIRPQIVVVERIVLKQRPWYVEFFKLLVAVVIVTGIVWGVTRAGGVGSF